MFIREDEKGRYKNLEEKEIKIISWAGVEEALQVIEESKAAYKK